MSHVLQRLVIWLVIWYMVQQIAAKLEVDLPAAALQTIELHT